MDVTNNLPAYGYKDDANIHLVWTTPPRKPADDGAATMLAQPGGSLHYVVPIPLDHYLDLLVCTFTATPTFKSAKPECPARSTRYGPRTPSTGTGQDG